MMSSRPETVSTMDVLKHCDQCDRIRDALAGEDIGQDEGLAFDVAVLHSAWEEMHREAATNRGVVWPPEQRWTDSDGAEGVIHDGRISIYAKPSMTREDGVVAVGVDLPDHPRGAVEARDLVKATRGLLHALRWGDADQLRVAQMEAHEAVRAADHPEGAV